MNVPSRIQAGSSPAPSQTWLRIAAVSSARMLLVPSLKPMRLRGVACARLVVDVRPNPSCDQRITTLPRPMRARLRTAWNATCGSSAHACTTRSPPERSRSSSSPGSARQVAQQRGLLRPQAEAVLAAALEERRSQPEGDRQLAPGVRPEASPVSAGGRGADVVGRRRPRARRTSAPPPRSSCAAGRGRRARSRPSGRRPRCAGGPARRWRSRPGGGRGTATVCLRASSSSSSPSWPSA